MSSEEKQSVGELSKQDVQESGSEPDLEEDEAERQKIRENLSSLSFEELLKLKEKFGSKVYNETVYGSKSKTLKESKELKRANKNRPREISSKIRPKQIKYLVANSSRVSVPKTIKVAPRDPRFDPICGEFDKKEFKQNYYFVNNMRQDEKKKLLEEYNECTDPKRKKTIKMLIQRIDNQLREEEKINKIKQKEEIEKLEGCEKLKKGEKPIFKRRAVKRLEGLVEKYEELKKTNRLQKHIQKRAKKLKVKDRKFIEKNNL